MIEAASFAVADGTRILGFHGDVLVLKSDVTLTLFDVAARAVVARRDFAKLTYLSVHGRFVQVDVATRPRLVPLDDLAGEGFLLPDLPGHRVIDVLEDRIAVLHDYGKWSAFDLQTKRVVASAEDEETRWCDSHGGMLVGVRDRTRTVVAMCPADGVLVWETEPFAEKIDELSSPIVHGDEVHVRANLVDSARVARLDVHTGAVLAVRSGDLSSFMFAPDLGEDLERDMSRFHGGSDAFGVGDALVTRQHDQIIVVRRTGIARVATPALGLVTSTGSHLAAVTKDAARVSVVVLPLPPVGDHDLEITHVGEDADRRATRIALGPATSGAR